MGVDGFSINICNDTTIPCNNENGSFIMFNSIAIYRNKNGNCTRIAGQFFNEINYLKKDGDKYVYSSIGDYCKTADNIVYNYTTFYEINNAPSGQESVQYMDLPVPNSDMNQQCDRTLKINVDLENITDQLLIQKFFSDYYIMTGIIFVILGIYLLFFAKFKKSTKFIINIIFGEICIFTLFIGLAGIHYIHMEWAFLIAGLALGGFGGYFSLGGNKLYRVILSLTSGYIFGLIFFDIIFTHLCTRLSQILLFDTLIIFMSLFLLIICFQHPFHYFFDSIIGGYLFMRGLCLLMKDAGKYTRYRELHLLLYLIGKNEIELAEYYYKESWPIYYVYTIIMILLIAGSIVYYYFRLYKKDEEALIEKEEETQKQLMNENCTTSDDIRELE